MHVKGTDVDHHVTVDRTAPLDYEIYQIQSVTGIAGDGADDVPFRPFYSVQDFTPSGDTHQAYYNVRRRMRQRSEKQRLKGVRTSYLGSEIHVSLCDRNEAPYPSSIKQLAVTALCTNRDPAVALGHRVGRDRFHPARWWTGCRNPALLSRRPAPGTGWPRGRAPGS